MAGGSVSIEVAGLREVEVRLATYEAKVRTGLLATTRPGAKALRDAIAAEAPVGTVARPRQSDVPGNLRKSVQFKASRTKRTGYTGHVVAPYGKGSAHRYLVIAGHKLREHSAYYKLRPGKLVEIKGKYTGDETTPNPFVRRGREKVEAQALATAEAAGLAVIEKAVRP